MRYLLFLSFIFNIMATPLPAINPDSLATLPKIYSYSILKGIKFGENDVIASAIWYNDLDGYLKENCDILLEDFYDTDQKTYNNIRNKYHKVIPDFKLLHKKREKKETTTRKKRTERKQKLQNL